MARPKKENKYIQAGFKLPKELLDALDAYVEKNMENRSIVVRKAIYEYLIRRGDTIPSLVKK